MPSAARNRGRSKVPGFFKLPGARSLPLTTRSVPTGGSSTTGAATSSRPAAGRQPWGLSQARAVRNSWTRSGASLAGRSRRPRMVSSCPGGKCTRWWGGKVGWRACWQKAAPRSQKKIRGSNRAGRRASQTAPSVSHSRSRTAGSHLSGRLSPQAGAAIPAIRARTTGARGREKGGFSVFSWRLAVSKFSALRKIIIKL